MYFYPKEKLAFDRSWEFKKCSVKSASSMLAPLVNADVCRVIFLFSSPVRDTFCSYPVMDLCTKGLGQSIPALKV